MIRDRKDCIVLAGNGRQPSLPGHLRQGLSHEGHPGKGDGRHRQSGRQCVIRNGAVGTQSLDQRTNDQSASSRATPGSPRMRYPGTAPA